MKNSVSCTSTAEASLNAMSRYGNLASLVIQLASSTRATSDLF